MYPPPCHTRTHTHTQPVSHLCFSLPSSPPPALCETADAPPFFFFVSESEETSVSVSTSSPLLCVCVRVCAHPLAHTNTLRLPCAAVMALSCQNIPAFTHYLPPKQPGSLHLRAGSQGRLSTFSSLPFISLPTLSPSFRSFVIFLLPFPSFPQVFLLLPPYFSTLLNFSLSLFPSFLSFYCPSPRCRVQSPKKKKRNLSAAVAFSHCHSKKRKEK